MLTLLAWPLLPQSAQAQPIRPEEVDRAIDSAVRFFLTNQRPDGGWPEIDRYPLGVSSLVTLALLNAGLPPERPEMQRALEYISSQELSMTYAVSLQTMVWCAANPNKYANRIKANAEWLCRAQHEDNGAWGYSDRRSDRGDPSNSQYALLALHEAQRTGTQFPAATWRTVFGRAANYWKNIQNANGSFPYQGSGADSRGSMTSAGIASLVIVGAQLEELEGSANGEIRCCGQTAEQEDRIEQALGWLQANFQVSKNPGTINQYQMYYLYALERAGRLTGRRFIGDHDWYREGAEYIVRNLQGPNGKIKGIGTGGNDFSDTAFGLLFLAKGKRQLVVSRLQYNSVPVNDWNHHRTAVQNLTAHTEQAWKRDLSWQNLDLSRSFVEDLLETPVLFISGTTTPGLSRSQKQKLKEYVEQGGFIFIEGCDGNGCDGEKFESYIQKLVVELFDQPLEKLPPEHPIWYAEGRVMPDELPAGAWLYGVQTCCRLGVVYCPYSLSCRWELNLPYGAKPNFAPDVQEDLDTATKIGLNVLAYATGKELKEKLDTVTILDEVQNLAPTDRGVFFLPTLKHNAGYDDAPQAVPNLIEWLDKENPFQLSSEKRAIGITPEELRRYPVVFVHGRGELRLTEKQRDVLREYLNNGGFLFGDAICADEQFVESFRREMQLVVGEPLEALAESHPLLTDEFYGFDVRQVEMLDSDLSGENIISSKRKITPRLEVGKVEGRIAVVFSPLDLSCALESRHSLQCRGYVREDAARLGINILLFALQN